MRKKIPENIRLILFNENGEKSIYDIVNLISEEGASCLCYIARKILGEFDSKLIILKEFYPNNSLVYNEDIVRDDNGYLHLNFNNVYLRDKYLEYVEGVKEIRNYAQKEFLNEYVCVDKDVEPLYAQVENSTVYCENLYYPNSTQWVSHRQENKLSEILNTVLGVTKFLDVFHRETKKAYVDLKPQDVLIAPDALGNYRLEYPLFFDFDAVRSLGQCYEKKAIKCTSGFCPSYFEKYNSDQILINVATENCTLMNVVDYMTKNKVDKELLKEIINNNKIKNNTEKEYMSESDIYKEIEEIKKKLEDEECVQMGKKYQMEKKKYSIVRIFVCILLIGLYLGFSYLIYKMSTGKSNGEEFYALLLVLAIALLILVCKFVNYRLASRISNLQVSCKYYDKLDMNGKHVRDKNYNTFRDGKTRKSTTFQDTSENNMNQQHLRWVLWSVLVLGIGSAIGLSIVFKALPLMFAIGLVVCVAVMWIDYKPSSIKDFIRYAKKLYSWDKNRFERTFNVDVKKLDDGKTARAIFYYREFSKVNSFDINDDYYKRKKRNLFALRKNLCNEGFNIDKLNKKPNKFNYDKRMDYFELNRTKNIDLDFEKLKIKQIYKMAFDRMKNGQLIVYIASSLIMFVVIVLACVNCWEGIERYIRIPSNVGMYSSVVLAILSSIFGIIQIIYALSEEKLVSEMSYKSNFVNQNSLNEMLVNDIAAGYIHDVDIARGTSQYEGYVFSRIPGEKEHVRNERLRMFLSSDNVHNMPLWHYREISNRRRLAVTLWCMFGAVASLVVWYWGLYYLFLPMLIFTLLLHLIIRNVIMPSFGKRSAIKEINRIIIK